MRDIPESFQQAFQDQQGLRLHFVIAINWLGVEEIKYAECEFDSVYAYVREFSSFESVSHVEGLGSVSSIQVEFNDQFGHFKEKIDTIDFFNSTTATIYLTLDGIEYFDLFQGKISDTATWSNNIFTIEVVSEPLDREIGYTPSIDDVDEGDPNYDALDRRLNTSGTWPSVFGVAKYYEAPIILNQRQAKVEEDVPYEPSGTPSYYVLPVDSTEDFTLDFEYNVNLVGRDQSAFSILGTGEFKTGNIFHLNKAGITSKWYQNISFEILDEIGISGETETPKTRIEIDPGTVTVDGTPLDTLGPLGDPTTSVWLQFMKVEVRYTVTVGATTVSTSKYLNCVKQQGNICTLNEQLVLPSGATDVYIRSVFKANDIIYSIPSGSGIYIMGDRVHYAIDSKAGTTVDFLGLKRGEELEAIDPSVYTVGSTSLWTGNCPPLTYAYMDAEVYMRYLEHYELKDNQSSAVLVSASNSLVTDALAIANISDLTVLDDNPKTTSFVYLDVESANDILPEVAWQANKAIRFTREAGDDVLELIDLTTPGAALHTFTDANVLRHSVTYGFTPQDNIYTVFKADYQTNDMLKDLQTLRYKKNVDKYTEKVLESDYYIFPSKTNAETSLQWWSNKLSKYYYTISLVGFLDAFHLEVWDRVSVNISDISFYDPSDGTPFTNTHTATPTSWVASGRVKSISPDLKEGTISFTIELDTVSGVSTN